MVEHRRLQRHFGNIVLEVSFFFFFFIVCHHSWVLLYLVRVFTWVIRWQLVVLLLFLDLLQLNDVVVLAFLVHVQLDVDTVDVLVLNFFNHSMWFSWSIWSHLPTWKSLVPADWPLHLMRRLSPTWTLAVTISFDVFFLLFTLSFELPFNFLINSVHISHSTILAWRFLKSALWVWPATIVYSWLHRSIRLPCWIVMILTITTSCIFVYQVLHFLVVPNIINVL